MSTFNLPVAVSLLIGLVLGLGAAWVWLRSRAALELERARSEVAAELASLRERASRIPMLETQLANVLDSEQSLRAEILRLTEEQAERRQLLRSTEVPLAEAKAQLLLHDLQEMTIREIASALGIAREAAKSRLHRGRSLVREFLAGGRPV